MTDTAKEAEEAIQVRKGKQHFEGIYTQPTPHQFFDALGKIFSGFDLG